MKRFLCVGLCAIVIISLCGCSAREAITSDKQEYLVASLGFDRGDEGFNMLMEALVVNTDDMEAEKKNIVLEGKGRSIDEAYSQIISKITQPLSLGHNGVTVIGKSITQKMLGEILEFCSNNKKLNIGTLLIFCDNAKELLSCEPISSVAVGYDLMNMLEVAEESRGTDFENSLYQVKAKSEKPLKTFALPKIRVEDKKFYLEGLEFFEYNRQTAYMDLENFQLLSLITDRVSKGDISVNGGRVRVEYSKTAYSFSYNNALEITVNMRIKGEGKALLRDECQRLIEDYRQKGMDIFGFGNILYQKNYSLWKKINNNYADNFKNAIIKVNVNE